MANGLSTRQVNQESGGKQFDRNGNPLTSKKGAIGVAQIMPETGPEAAKLAGVAWDENRYKTDAAYNRKLGDAYMDAQRKRFNGDEVAATAAYNAGPTRVAKLQARHGANWQQHLPAETKDYLQRILGVAVPSAKPGLGQSLEGIVANLAVRPEPYKVGDPTKGETANYSDSKGQVNAISGNGIDPATMSAAVTRQQKATNTYADFLDNALTQVRANSAEVEAVASRVATTKENLFTDIAGREAELEEKIKPHLERRAKLIARLEELDNMSPLQRSLKGMFNADYNKDVIEGKLARVDTMIGLHNQSYEELNKLRSGVAGLSVEADAADGAVLDARARSINAEAGLLGQIVNATANATQAVSLPLEMQVNTLKLEATQKNVLLGNATTEQVTKWYNDASASPDGTITVDGVKFTVGELQGASRESQGQDMRFQSLKNAHALNDMQTYDYLETQMIDHMSVEQVAEAMKAGGVWNGQQLSMSKLAGAAQTTQAARTAAVDQIVGGTAQGTAVAIQNSMSDFWGKVGERTVEMFGKTPPMLTQIGAQVVHEKQVWEEGRKAAAKAGVENDYIRTTLPQLQSMQKRLEDATEEVAKTWGGGNASMTAVASAYLRGLPLTGDAATDGLMQIARAGMPAGSKMSGPAQAAIRAAAAVIEEADNPATANGQDIGSLLAGGKKMTAAELKRRVQQTVANVYADNITDQVMKSLPQIARNVRDENNPGKLHPFARVREEDYRMAVAHGDEEGFAATGKDLGLSPLQVKQMFNQGVKGAIWQQVSKAKGLSDGQFNDFLENTQAVQLSAMMEALDASHSAAPGFKPSKAFADLLQNPAVSNQVDQMVGSYGVSDFGAFLVSNAAGGGYREGWATFADNVQRVQIRQNSAQLQEQIRQQRSLFGDPMRRMDTVLRAGGLNAQESQTLVNATRSLFKQRGPDVNQMDAGEKMIYMRTGMAMTAQTRQNFDDLTYIIQNHKFEDPNVERLRQRASKSWAEMNAVVGRIQEGR